MKPLLRLALLLSLVAGLGLALSAPAPADNPPADHPFCAQGGESVTGGAGGTEQTPGAADDEFDGEEPSTVLIPRHLAEDFGSTEDEDEDGDGFIEVAAPSEGEGPVGQAAGAFEGGHGGGPGGGQGGSTFISAGDGGCGPQFREVGRPPSRRLPVTGPTTQFLLMGAIFMILGASFVFAPQIVSAVNSFFATVLRSGKKKASVQDGQIKSSAGEGSLPTSEVATGPSSPPAAPAASDLVSRLRDEIKRSWDHAN